MADFCTCGSLVINEHCTNKNCTFKTSSKQTTETKTKSKKRASSDKPAKATKTKRASKCITYNLNDEKYEEENDY